MSTVKETGKIKKRIVFSTQARQMIANVYRYLKEEYKFTVLYLEPNCDISHLRNITERTAAATGVSPRTVQKILKEERDGEISSEFDSPKHKQRKKGKIKEEIESESEEDANESTEETISKEEEDATRCPNSELPTKIEIKIEDENV